MKLVCGKQRLWKTFVDDCLQVDVWGVPHKIVAKKIHSLTVLSTLKRGDNENKEMRGIGGEATGGAFCVRFTEK